MYVSMMQIRSAAAHIRDSALDAVFAAVLAPDQLLPHKQFTAECTPIAEARDRHVARSLPFKSPEKHHYPIAEKLASPSRAVRSENSPDRAVGGSWRRRNMGTRLLNPISVLLIDGLVN